MGTTRTLISHALGGEDRSIPSHRSAETVYSLENLRPTRGAYEQTEVLGVFVDDFVSIEDPGET